ncbi:hypothetical protein [Streptomyces sp. WAC08241]|uniref:hypothetical protein n=1 Tax=Streptomyces sp. WAC08241 TaxID=2487421 RepID=UPI000F799306|nr:hypothetical protein [Streptomyces sp. WAC08241]RSS33773.1 hypothetical protein EF906_31055 [Streptomyces sp. WAC08241]
MITNLGLHNHRDLHTELATLHRKITALTGKVQIGLFRSWEDEHNTRGNLHHLQNQADVLQAQADAEDAEIARLAHAIHLVGDLYLGFIAYVIYGPDALPMEPRYEVRLIERHGRGYTVPCLIRRDLTADQVDDAKRELYAEALKPGGHARLWGFDGRDYRTLVTKY